jgi:ribosomal protein S6
MDNTIDEFMENWKVKSLEYYNGLRNGYFEIIKNKSNLTKNEAIDLRHLGYDVKEGNKGDYYRGVLYLRTHFGRNFRMQDYVKSIDAYWNEYITKLIDKEAEAKKIKLIAQIEKKAGKFVSTEYLYIGQNGDINGRVVGDKATVYVETIGAGGYNVQRYHYRVLVKEVKE